MDALHNRETVDDQSYKKRLNGRVWMSPDVDVGHVLGGSEIMRNIVPMSGEDFERRFSSMRLEGGENDESNGGGMKNGRGEDRFNQIKSSLRELRRGQVSPADDEESVQLPCEFCSVLVPLVDLVQHQVLNGLQGSNTPESFLAYGFYNIDSGYFGTSPRYGDMFIADHFMRDKTTNSIGEVIASWPRITKTHWVLEEIDYSNTSHMEWNLVFHRTIMLSNGASQAVSEFYPAVCLIQSVPLPYILLSRNNISTKDVRAL
ncbi:unnamed protein product [Leptidea sinapis]|uniref:Uncharacterized protein n=1 Tax=Leptidea sinapis TaxID=189913 RepID=A0A5E4QJQ7_9NEOP|nr:unnamed protein product [Leptidea sinapis]